jgi:hypothetical protein
VCGEVWRHTSTHKGLSLYGKTAGPRPTARLRHVCMCLQGVLVRRRAGGKHTSKAALCSAQSPGRCGPAFRMQAAPRSTSPRSWRPRFAGAKLWSARGEAGAAARRGRLRADDMTSSLSQARPRPHARLGFGAGRGEREGFSFRPLPRVAGFEARLHLGKARQGTASRKKRSLFVGYIASGS